MFIKLTGGNKALYGQSTQKMDHNICETGLFTDNNLIRALDMHPPDYLDICTSDSFTLCDRGTATSRELLEAVKRGALWLNLRHLHELSTPHGRLVKHMHKAFARHLGIRTHSRSASLIIASPRANVDYHFDVTDMAVWHLRGRKRLIIYPNTAPFITPKNIQKIVRDGGMEKLLYHPNFESQSISLELQPGELLCWPHLSPRRVENLEGLNVSMSLQSFTPRSRARVGSHYFDGVINQRYNQQFETTSQKPSRLYIKALLAEIIKASKKETEDKNSVNPPLFRVDLKVPNCLRPI